MIHYLSGRATDKGGMDLVPVTEQPAARAETAELVQTQQELRGPIPGNPNLSVLIERTISMGLA